MSGGGENTSFATSKLGGENTCFYNGLWVSIWWFCVTICGFCWFLYLGLLYFFLQKSRWPVVIGGFDYGFTIERKERERFWVLENLVMGS